MTNQQGRYFWVSFMILAAGTAVNANAGDGKGDPTSPVYQISWDDFKYRCSDAKDKPLNEQGKPENIRVQCTNVEREFVPASPGSIPLENTRHVITTVLSSKFDVAAMGKDYPGNAGKGAGSCMRYKEVERTIQIEKSLSCSDILGIKGDVNDYCAANLDTIKGTSPKLIETRDTGVTKDTCGTDGGKK